MQTLTAKTLFITGASRGIGKAIALWAAADGAIRLTGTVDTTLKDFDLMFSVNVRASFACSQACLPHLRRADNPHILNLSPPLSMRPEWFRDHVAYSMSRYAMSMCALGMAEEFRPLGVAVNALGRAVSSIPRPSACCKAGSGRRIVAGRRSSPMQCTPW